VTTDNISSIIGKLVNSHDVLLFMKGTVDRPQCGYSNTVVKILKDQGVQNIKGVNILADQIMR
jgi:monothiol glutaredoxin